MPEGSSIHASPLKHWRQTCIPRDMGDRPEFVWRVQRRCLVCDWEEDVWEAETTDEIGPACSRCGAPTERVAVVERTRKPRPPNPHAAWLGRLGGLRGGPARAARLSPERRRAIAQAAARARWQRQRPRS